VLDANMDDSVAHNEPSLDNAAGWISLTSQARSYLEGGHHHRADGGSSSAAISPMHELSNTMNASLHINDGFNRQSGTGPALHIPTSYDDLNLHER